jgi:MFS transporter, DHA2 family, multidrug resistance protein
MNAFMSADTAGPELILAQIVRALGQPLVMTAVSNFATLGVPPTLMASSSGMYNMTRNLGGSVGIAVLATLLTTRQQVHSARIGESVSLYDLATQTRLDQLTQNFIARGAEPSAAAEMALRTVDNIVRRESFVMAYNDAFLVLAAALLACIAVVWLGRRVVGGEGPAPAPTRAAT